MTARSTAIGSGLAKALMQQWHVPYHEMLFEVMSGASPRKWALHLNSSPALFASARKDLRAINAGLRAANAARSGTS